MESNSSINQTENITDLYVNAIYYYALGWVHLITVVMPSLFFGPVFLSVLLSEKKFRDSPSILFASSIVLSVLGPLTYGLLMDFSLITDLQVFGDCRLGLYRMFWFGMNLFGMLRLYTTAVLTTVQYIIVRWGAKKMTRKRVTVIYLATCFVILSILVVSTAAVKSGAAVKIRGGYCALMSLESRLILLHAITGSVVGGSIPATVLSLTSTVLTRHYIKLHTIENAANVKRLSNVVIFQNIPLFHVPLIPVFLSVLVKISSTSDIPLALLTAFYVIELNYPYFLLVVFLGHKTFRNSLYTKLKLLQCSSFKRQFGKRFNQVSPFQS